MNESTSLGHFRLEAKLGEGYHTVTWRAFDTVRLRYVALKTLRKSSIFEEIHLPDFLAQAQRAEELVHPHLAWIWETGFVENQAYLAERYVTGEALHTILQRTGPLSWNQALEATIHIAQGLSFAHEKGFVHTQITPRRIMISEEHGAVLTGFGFLIALQAQTQNIQKLFWQKAYTPPELLKGKLPSPANDQYSLACVLYTMLTAEVFHPIEEESDTWKNELRQEQLGLLPGELRPILSKALSEDDAERFIDVHAFVEQLRALDTETGETIQQFLETHTWPQQKAETFESEAEKARQKALEEARREIEALLHQKRELPIPTPAEEAIERDSLINEVPKRETPTQRKTKRKSLPGWFFPAALLFIVLAVLVTGLWLDRQLSTKGVFVNTPTPTTPAPSTTPTFTPIPSPTNTATFTTTHTASPTASGTPTRTPTKTATSTITPTATQSGTPSRTPKTPISPGVVGSGVPPNTP